MPNIVTEYQLKRMLRFSEVGVMASEDSRKWISSYLKNPEKNFFNWNKQICLHRGNFFFDSITIKLCKLNKNYEK